MKSVAIAHVKITVKDFELSKKFYDRLFKFLELKKMFWAGDKSMWGGKIVGYGTEDYTFEIQEGSKCSNDRFDRERIGLDHIAFTSPKREAVDNLYRFLLKMKKKYEINVEEPKEYPYCKDYYATFFTDPDGIILEYVHMLS